jgi:hypothetical protein
MNESANINYYKQILNIFPEIPKLSSLKDNIKIPENWPLLLSSIIKTTPESVLFSVSDLKETLTCELKDEKMINKLILLEIGQIIFLHKSKAKLNKLKNTLKIEVGSIYTLKEINDQLAQSKNNPNTSHTSKLHKNKVQINKIKYQDSNKNESKWRTLKERWTKQGKHTD